MKFDLKYLSKQSKKLKDKGFKIGLCHGVFDVIHAGHINHFTEVKKNVITCSLLLRKTNTSIKVQEDLLIIIILELKF